MKKRKTKNYIVIGTAHLGMDLGVLQVIKTAADYYNAEVVHVGPLATKDELAMWRRREKKLRVWENSKFKAVKSKSEKIGDLISDLDSQIDDLKEDIRYSPNEEKTKLSEKLQKTRARTKELTSEENLLWERLGQDRERLRGEKEELENIQWNRISSLRAIFGKSISFVCNDELHIPWVSMSAEKEEGLSPRYAKDEDGKQTYLPRNLADVLGKKYVDKHLSIGRHLFVTAVPANGDRMAGMPITPRTFKMLKAMGHSHIVPHMTTHIKPFARTGLNQAYNFWTTGAAQICDHPKKITEAYKSSARASCVLVSLDQKNDEFHAQRLRIKMFWGEKAHRQVPHIIHDGIVFDSEGMYETLPSVNKAMHSTDMHAPHEHMGVVGSIRAMNELHRPKVYIDGGDTADMESISPHTKGKPGERENLRLTNDLTALKRVLDAMASEKDFPWIDERVLLDSNHGEWLTRFVEENPTLKGLCDWKTVAKNMLQDWNVFIRSGGDDKFYLIGDLHIKHADKEGSVSKAHDVYGNYLGGHHHSYQEFGDAIFAGPGCSLGPKYLQNSATSWQNQATTITIFRGRTCKHPKTIFHTEASAVSRFAYGGQIYEVPFHKYK